MYTPRSNLFLPLSWAIENALFLAALDASSWLSADLVQCQSVIGSHSTAMQALKFGGVVVWLKQMYYIRARNEM